MKVTIAGKELKIYWRYFEAKGRRHTYCSVSFSDKRVVWVHTSCSKKDRFSKETGRKISLARALKSLRIPRWFPVGWVGRKLTKAERTKIWAAYHGRKDV